jgi:ABC-type proline/glycine betaine transport system ATPase subunit
MISFSNVSFQYAEGEGVKNIDAKISKGECVVFTGTSGCGNNVQENNMLTNGPSQQVDALGRRCLSA